MTLTVQIGGRAQTLGEDHVWYVVATGSELSLSTIEGAPGQVAYFVRLLAGWYLRTDDPRHAALRLGDVPVTGVSTPVRATALRLSRGPVATHELPSRAPQTPGYDEAAIIRALRSACPTYEDLEQLLAFRLEVELTDLVPPGDMRNVAVAVVRTARAHEWLLALLTAIGYARPHDPAVADVLSQGALNALEGITNDNADFIDPMVFGANLIEYVPRVCRITMATPRRTRYGTGFLVGPDLVLTNHHVLAEVLDGSAAAGAVLFRFDYRVVGDDVEHGRDFRLAPDWRVADSPPSPADWDQGPVGGAVAATDELDYALVRLDTAVGREILPSGVERGWLRLLTQSPPLRPGMRLVILQHPQHGPIKLALDHDGVLAVNGNASRVTHRVNTLPGSSGSPCFTDEFDLVALHHAGFEAMRNEAIPIRTIIEHLRARGHYESLAC